MQKAIGRPREWKDASVGSLRVPKITVSPVRAIAHAIDDGIVTEVQVVEWLRGMRDRMMNIKFKGIRQFQVWSAS